MLTVSLDADTERRVAERARASGLSDVDLVRSLIDDGLDDLDDAQMVTDRLANPRVPLTAIQARRALGLED
jgi:hypothetical protein